MREMREIVERGMDLEPLLEKKQQHYTSNVVQRTSKEEIFILLDALTFCEKNYQHRHEGTDRYIRSNIGYYFEDDAKNLLEGYAKKKIEVENDANLRNYGMADLLMRSLLEYVRQAAPKAGKAETEAKVKAILEPVFFPDVEN